MFKSKSKPKRKNDEIKSTLIKVLRPWLYGLLTIVVTGAACYACFYAILLAEDLCPKDCQRARWFNDRATRTTAALFLTASPTQTPNYTPTPTIVAPPGQPTPTFGPSPAPSLTPAP